jgi:4-hydroxy-L-threonine phosphate dehydrogenase PdxA
MHAFVGDARVMTHAVTLTKVPLKIVVRQNWSAVMGKTDLLEIFDLVTLDPQEYRMGKVSPKAGQAWLEYLDIAIDQGQIAMKLLGRASVSINDTAHGTAFGIADIGAFQAA